LVIRPQDSVVTIQSKEAERLAGCSVYVIQRPERVTELQVKINAAMKYPAIAEFLKTYEVGLEDKSRGPHIVRSGIIDQAKREVVAKEGFTIRGEYKKVSLETGCTVSGFVYSRLDKNGTVLNPVDQSDNEFRRCNHVADLMAVVDTTMQESR
jgi:hypothetical protein